MLWSKKKKHYLTIGFRDAQGNTGVAIFELAKGIAQQTSIQVFRSARRTDHLKAIHGSGPGALCSRRGVTRDVPRTLRNTDCALRVTERKAVQAFALRR